VIIASDTGSSLANWAKTTWILPKRWFGRANDRFRVIYHETSQAAALLVAAHRISWETRLAPTMIPIITSTMTGFVSICGCKPGHTGAVRGRTLSPLGEESPTRLVTRCCSCAQRAGPQDAGAILPMNSSAYLVSKSSCNLQTLSPRKKNRA
jgi:hypothetical protein